MLDVGCGRDEWLLRLRSARVRFVRADAGEWLGTSPASDAAKSGLGFAVLPPAARR